MMRTFGSELGLGSHHLFQLGDFVRKEYLLFGHVTARRVIVLDSLVLDFLAIHDGSLGLLEWLDCTTNEAYDYALQLPESQSLPAFVQDQLPSNVRATHASQAASYSIYYHPNAPLTCPPPSYLDKSVPVDAFLAYARAQYAHYGNFSEPIRTVDPSGVLTHSSSLSSQLHGPALSPFLQSVSPTLLPRADAAAKPGATLLLFEHDSGSNTTYNVFFDVILSLSHHFSELGYNPVLLRCHTLLEAPCSERDLAKVGEESAKVVVIAPHTLTRAENDDGPVVLQNPSLLPRGTVLYNYEVIPTLGEVGGKGFATQDVLNLYRLFDVWDYSIDNVARLAHHGVKATVVPLSSAPGLSLECEDGREDIDVLFYGTMTPYRHEVINQLREAGVVVHVPTLSTWGLYGAALDDLICRARVILNVNTWGGGEWKITRFARPLASGRFVISETTGGGSEEIEFSEGVVFVTKEGLVEAVQVWLGDDDGGSAETKRMERIERGERGKEIFSNSAMATALRGALGSSKDYSTKLKTTREL
jgi:hypothetical protein